MEPPRALAQAVAERGDHDQAHRQSAPALRHKAGSTVFTLKSCRLPAAKALTVYQGTVSSVRRASGMGRSLPKDGGRPVAGAGAGQGVPHGALAYPSDVDGVFGQVLEHVGVGVGAIATDQQTASGGQRLAQVLEVGLGHGVRSLLLLLLFILPALEGGGFFRRFGRGRRVREIHRDQVRATVGAGPGGGQLQITLATHQIDLELRAARVAFPAHAVSALPDRRAGTLRTG